MRRSHEARNIDETKSKDLLEKIVGSFDEGQVKAFNLMTIFQELLFEPVDNKPAAAVDERHKR